MDYKPLDDTEKNLHSRIRRCYGALADLQAPIEYLFDNTDHLNEHYAVEDVNRMHETYREVARDLIDVADLNMVDKERGVQYAEERLVGSPSVADDICRAIEYVHDRAKTVIRNIEYQLDADHFTLTDDIYQTIREKAISILGLTNNILDVLNKGFPC